MIFSIGRADIYDPIVFNDRLEEPTRGAGDTVWKTYPEALAALPSADMYRVYWVDAEWEDTVPYDNEPRNIRQLAQESRFGPIVYALYIQRRYQSMFRSEVLEKHLKSIPVFRSYDEAKEFVKYQGSPFELQLAMVDWRKDVVFEDGRAFLNKHVLRQTLPNGIH